MIAVKGRSIRNRVSIFAYYWWFRELPSSGVPCVPLAT